MKALIIYATHSGSTYMASTEVLRMMSGAVMVKMVEASKVNKSDLDEVDIVVFGSSSWDYEGNRGYPIKEMMELMERVSGYDFSTKKIALYGCGDKDFEHFCGAVDVIAEYLEKGGASFVIDPLRIDRYYIDELSNRKKVEEWTVELLEKLGDK